VVPGAGAAAGKAASPSAEAADSSVHVTPDDSSSAKLQALLHVCSKAAESPPDVIDEALELQMLECFEQLTPEQQNVLWDVAAIGAGISQRRLKEFWVSLYGVHAAEWFTDMRNKLVRSAGEDRSCRIVPQQLAAAIQRVLRMKGAADCDTLVGQLRTRLWAKYCGTREWLERNGPPWQVAGGLQVNACICLS
jgi:hypothetical protein